MTVIMGILMVTILPFFKVSVNAYVQVRAGKDSVQAARIGFNRMMAEMRLIEDSDEIDCGYSYEIRFDLPTQNNINYTFEDGMLKREGEKLVEGVQSLVIQYYRANGSQKSSGFWYDDDVWRIQIIMVAGDGTNNITMRGQVSPRNFHL